MGIPSEQALWKMGKSADEWLAEHNAKVRADGARDFAEWLINTEYVASQGHFILPLRGYFTIDEVVSEWEQLKEKK